MKNLASTLITLCIILTIFASCEKNYYEIIEEELSIENNETLIDTNFVFFNKEVLVIDTVKEYYGSTYRDLPSGAEAQADTVVYVDGPYFFKTVNYEYKEFIAPNTLNNYNIDTLKYRVDISTVVTTHVAVDCPY